MGVNGKKALYKGSMLTGNVTVTSKSETGVYIKPYIISKDGKVLYDTLTLAGRDYAGTTGEYDLEVNSLNVCDIIKGGDTVLSIADSSSYDYLGVAFGEYTKYFTGDDSNSRYLTTADVDLGAEVIVEYVELGTDSEGVNWALVKSVRSV